MSEHGNNRIRVLIVDDYVLLREAFCALLNKEDDFEVVGWTGTPEGALTLARALRPDIVLFNIALGTTNGLDLAKQLQWTPPLHAL
jgi:DNA-binding NarL/FixJ family response regulator